MLTRHPNPINYVSRCVWMALSPQVSYVLDALAISYLSPNIFRKKRKAKNDESKKSTRDHQNVPKLMGIDYHLLIENNSPSFTHEIKSKELDGHIDVTPELFHFSSYQRTINRNPFSMN